jgi:hypothetical protein
MINKGTNMLVIDWRNFLHRKSSFSHFLRMSWMDAKKGLKLHFHVALCC